MNADGVIGQIGELLGHNLFAYGENSPVNMSDKNGFRPIYTMDEEIDEMMKASLAAMAKSSKIILVLHIRVMFSLMSKLWLEMQP